MKKVVLKMASILLSHFQFTDGRIIPSEIILPSPHGQVIHSDIRSCDHILGYLRYSPFQYALDKTVVDRKTGKRIKNQLIVCSHCSSCKYSLDLMYVSKLLISDMMIFVVPLNEKKNKIDIFLRIFRQQQPDSQLTKILNIKIIMTKITRRFLILDESDLL